MLAHDDERNLLMIIRLSKLNLSILPSLHNQLTKHMIHARWLARPMLCFNTHYKIVTVKWINLHQTMSYKR